MLSEQEHFIPIQMLPIRKIKINLRYSISFKIFSCFSDIFEITVILTFDQNPASKRDKRPFSKNYSVFVWLEDC